MIGVDHVYIIQIGSSCFIGKIYRMMQGKVPDREGLKLGISAADPVQRVMVELTDAGCHLA